ncbi:hypothetical protein RRG08_054093 [Elysia crispata]|uniref:Secreted protein n=1 Tax=Elysia crispata TaxID=231223 RepID=A0AAE0ZD26_9GAST|nr:hypothetical protein RRG08_054093 [Elysia crispata]
MVYTLRLVCALRLVYTLRLQSKGSHFTADDSSQADEFALVTKSDCPLKKGASPDGLLNVAMETNRMAGNARPVRYSTTDDRP